MMRILYLGQKPIGEQCFNVLMQYQSDDLKIIGAVSNSTKDGTWWGGNRIYEICNQNRIQFIDSIKLNSTAIRTLILEKDADLLISVGYPWILPDEILRSVNYNAVNLHLAKLPDYKGNFTFNHAILNQEEMYGVTLHYMTADVDQGDYIDLREFRIEDSDTAYSLYNKSLSLGVKMFESFIVRSLQGKPIERKAMEGKGKFYDRHSIDGLREIKNITDDKEVFLKSRAFYFPPFENAFTYIRGRKFYIMPDEEENW